MNYFGHPYTFDDGQRILYTSSKERIYDEDSDVMELCSLSVPNERSFSYKDYTISISPIGVRITQTYPTILNVQ